MWRLLFLDNTYVEYLRGFRRRLEKLKKHPANPILRGEHPWEDRQLRLYGTVMRDSERRLWRMWYNCYHPGASPRTSLAYAESQDGFAWEKPVFEFVKRGGQKTNILYEGRTDCHGPSVLRDPGDPDPSRRYKLVHLEYHPEQEWRYGLGTAVSPDGLSWEPLGEKLGVDSDNGLSLVRDGERYVVYLRSRLGRPPVRRVARTVSDDFEAWSEPETVLEPDALDPPQTQFYGMAVSVIEPCWLGALQVYRTKEDDPGDYKMEGNIHLELACSSNGVEWHREPDREPWLELGGEGEWDAGNIVSAPPVECGDELRVYYAGVSTAHGEAERRGEGAIGVATTPRDRYVALEAGEEGELLTRTLSSRAQGLCANVSSQRGRVLFELLDPGMKVLDGYSLDECLGVSGDGVSLPVAWRRNALLPERARSGIRIRVRAHSARLYALSFESREA